MTKHKIAVVGSRSFVDYELLESILCDYIINRYGTMPGDCLIVSGGARGADGLSERFALDHGIETLIFEADWSKYGRAAGMVRNKNIVNNADVVFAFWDEKSKGTKNSIDLARNTNKELFIISYE